MILAIVGRMAGGEQTSEKSISPSRVFGRASEIALCELRGYKKFNALSRCSPSEECPRI
jgi:hypothetical protein